MSIARCMGNAYSNLLELPKELSRLLVRLPDTEPVIRPGPGACSQESQPKQCANCSSKGQRRSSSMSFRF